MNFLFFGADEQTSLSLIRFLLSILLNCAAAVSFLYFGSLHTVYRCVVLLSSFTSVIHSIVPLRARAEIKKH